jgi:DNA-directed RNA polymerase specialized sigma24 family protein
MGSKAYNPAVTRWATVLDPNANPGTREHAWSALMERIRPAILFQLRRRIRGWRETEDLADRVLERIRGRFEGRGPADQAARLRLCVEREVTLLCEERGAKGGIDPEFERDWSRGLLGAALEELGRVRPETRRILLRVYDRPEGQPPLTVAQLAAKLERPEDEVGHALDEARAALRDLFAREIAETVASDGGSAEEVAHLLPQAHALFE